MRTISLSTPRAAVRPPIWIERHPYKPHDHAAAELSQVLDAVPASGTRSDYASAIINDNVTNKKTLATRRVTNQRLRELFGIDPSIAVFRVLRRFWGSDVLGRPLLAQFCSLARDHLLQATGPVVLAVGPGGELSRQELRLAVQDAVGDRLNEATADKVVRNVSSSWRSLGI